MSKSQIRDQLVQQINHLLARPLGSAARGLPQEEIQQREQLKQLRSRLENLQPPDDIEAIERECDQLIAQIQNKSTASGSTSTTAASNVSGDRPPAKPDSSQSVSQELSQDLSKYQSILSVAESSWIKETGNTAAKTAEPSQADLAELKSQLAPVVQQAVQQTVQQVLERTLPVERALMIAEVTANLRGIVESNQLSPTPDLAPFDPEQQQELLYAEISKLESKYQSQLEQLLDRHKQQEQGFINYIQVSNQQLLNQITNEVSQAIQNIQPPEPPQPVEPPEQASQEQDQQEMVEEVRQRSDQFLLTLDTMFNATLKSLENNIQGYRSSLQEQLDQMQEAERRGEMLLQALVDRMGSEVQNLPPQARTVADQVEQERVEGDRYSSIDSPEATSEIPEMAGDTAEDLEDFNDLNNDLDFDEATINSLLTNTSSTANPVGSNLLNFPLNRNVGDQNLGDREPNAGIAADHAENADNFAESETAESQAYDQAYDLDQALEDLNIGLNQDLDTLNIISGASAEPELEYDPNGLDQADLDSLSNLIESDGEPELGLGIASTESMIHRLIF
jgi:hypothetical protein